MKNKQLFGFLPFLILLWTACQESTPKNEINLVSNAKELNEAIVNAVPGDEVVMANGEWNDLQIRFYGSGTELKPITLRAETAGEVILQGKSNLTLGGEYLKVEGLHFKNGFSPTNAVIRFGINDDTLAYHSQVTNCVITDFNKPQRNMTDLWVLFRGRHNQLDHCYIAGKSNRGPTVRVDLEGNQSIKNYHKIEYNHFGPRPPKGGPSAETIQIGNSSTSVTPSYTQVSNNFFEECNGEVEIISSKTNFNEFRNNVFYKSQGSLVTRHGNYCTVDGNYFIGDEKSEQIGGIRLIGTGHWVTNNYFYNLKGKNFRSPLAVMNGIPKSPQNRYTQVTDVVVAHNSWINCISPLQFGVGTNIAEKDVLPKSEIRSARPIRMLVANNLIHNDDQNESVIIAHDKIDGIRFESNVISNQVKNEMNVEGLQKLNFKLNEIEKNVFIPTDEILEVKPYVGFDFDQISSDLFGNSRIETNAVGATNGKSEKRPYILNESKYGTTWFNPTNELNEKTVEVNSITELINAIATANAGDVIELNEGNYELNSSLKIDKTITVKAIRGANVKILYKGSTGTPAFEMNPKGKLTIDGIKLQGTNSQFAFASLKDNMSSLYNLNIINSEITDFDYVLKTYKYSFSEFINIINTEIRNCKNGLELSAENDNRGDYNAENIVIDRSTFENVEQNVVDYYRGGYDESTVGGNLVISNSTFTQCGAKEANGILINTYGIINVNLSGNKFQNNKVKKIAQLWGAKNNTHSDNEIKNSGKIVVEENLTLKLIY